MKLSDPEIVSDHIEFASSINFLATLAHENSTSHGFWEANSDIGNKVALIHSELSEFFEGYRKDMLKQDEHCPDFTNMEIELADACIRILDLAGHFNFNLGRAIIAKMLYNESRPHLHGKKF